MGIAVSVVALIMTNFSETPLGRLLTALRLFLYFCNAVVDELRTPKPDRFAGELVPRPTAAPSRLSQTSAQQANLTPKSPLTTGLPPSYTHGTPDLLQPANNSARHNSVVRSSTIFFNSFEESETVITVEGSAIADSDTDSPLDVDPTSVDGSERRRRSAFQRVQRPQSILTSLDFPTGAVSNRTAKPLTSATLPSYRSTQTSVSNGSNLTTPQQGSMPLRLVPQRLPLRRQYSHESSWTADQSVCSSYQGRQHNSILSNSTSSSEAQSVSRARTFPMPPNSGTGDRQSTMILPSTSPINREKFVYVLIKSSFLDECRLIMSKDLSLLPLDASNRTP